MYLIFDVETTGLQHKKDSLLSLSYLVYDPKYGLIHSFHTDKIKENFKALIELNSCATFIGHNIKFDLRFLDVHPDIVDTMNLIDTTILYHYLFPREEKRLGSIEKHLFKTQRKEEYLEKYGKKFSEWPKDDLEKYNRLDVELTYAVYKKLIAHVDKDFLTFQNKFLKALYRIEYYGIGFDESKAVTETDIVKNLADKKEYDLRDYIYTNFGYESAHTINFNSSKQLSNLLYVDLDIPKPDRSYYPNGVAFDKLFTSTLTNADLLKTIPDPFVKMYLEWKQVIAVQKSIQSYAELSHDDRLYPSFNITGTRTGRLSCLAEGSKVLTKSGYKSIENIIDGDFVLSHLGNWQPVLHLIDNGIDDTYNIIFCSGDTLTCNKSHSIFTTVGWVTIEKLLKGDINYECIKVLGKESREHNKSIRDVSGERYTNTTDNSRSIRDNVPQYSLSSKTEFIGRGEISTKESTIRSLKTWNEKPNEWKDRNSTSQLYRGVRRWLRLPNLSAQWGTSICSQSSNGSSAGIRGTARNIFSSSYRPKSQKQSARQSGTLHSLRSQTDTLHVSKEYSFYSIKKIEFAGSARVFDLTVVNDHSYLSGCVFSHNCSQPNLQNIAKDKKNLPSVRNLFRPNEGEKIISIDYQQQEIRMLAVLSQDENLLDLVKQGVDMHTVMGKKMFRKEDITKEERTLVKGIMFGIIYGLSTSAVAFKIGCGVEYADDLVNTYYETFPRVKEFMQEVKEQAEQMGGLTLFTGRKWDCLPSMQYQAVNAIIQGSCAELTAMAVISVSKYLKKSGYGSILSIIHDETLYSLNDTNCIPEIVKRMQMVDLFGVPFLVDVDESY